MGESVISSNSPIIWGQRNIQVGRYDWYTVSDKKSVYVLQINGRTNFQVWFWVCVKHLLYYSTRRDLECGKNGVRAGVGAVQGVP